VVMSPTGLGPGMTALDRTSSNCKRQTHSLSSERMLLRTTTASVRLENKITGRESQGTCRQDKLIGGVVGE
jgi:hypothetical protein